MHTIHCEGFMNASKIDVIHESDSSLSDQGVQDTTQDHDASHETRKLSTSPEKVEIVNLIRK